MKTTKAFDKKVKQAAEFHNIETSEVTIKDLEIFERYNYAHDKKRND
jgi:serine protease inhibitor